MPHVTNWTFFYHFGEIWNLNKFFLLTLILLLFWSIPIITLSALMHWVRFSSHLRLLFLLIHHFRILLFRLLLGFTHSIQQPKIPLFSFWTIFITFSIYFGVARGRLEWSGVQDIDSSFYYLILTFNIPAILGNC